MKKILTILLILALLVGAVVLVKKKMAANAATPTLSSYDLSVKTFLPKEGNVTLSTPVLALVKNDHDASLSAKSPASILYIAPAGTHVKKGDVVIRLDNNDLMAQKEAMKLSLNNEMAAHQRSRELYNVKGVSVEQLQNEESHIAILKADLARVSNQIDYTIIHSSVDGTVGETFAAVGDVAVPGKPLASVRAASGGYLWVRVALGTPAKSLFYENRRAPLHFLQNANGMDEYRADMMVNLPSGARIDAKMLTFEGSGIYLPREAILLKEGKAYVLVVEGHGAKAHEISIVARGDEGFVASSVPSGSLALAKSDILLKLLGGASLAIKE
ncbi:efflux transporter periplasmic adaptor subunit [Sulfuricurvum sp.]|uniref:efflux RND transporter periplasmic adaptor subunit n=1 Tax=Sulfuricurvum sp. TaxID=2025608 RepID=UPI00261A55AF|nr:efflux transporter periplasmic adaptor subunit [Sulfuricurvum sp.]MDD2781530.1 efflux transporter periplasmic adaptor subunit [Sulfuricurvum sp.]